MHSPWGAADFGTNLNPADTETTSQIICELLIISIIYLKLNGVKCVIRSTTNCLTHPGWLKDIKLVNNSEPLINQNGKYMYVLNITASLKSTNCSKIQTTLLDDWTNTRI